MTLRKRIMLVLYILVLMGAGYLLGSRHATVAYAGTVNHANIPKSYGRLVAAIADQIGTGLVFEDAEGVIRFVSVTGMKEGELARYGEKSTHGGIPKAYGRLVTAVVNPGGTSLVFEDGEGVIRLVTVAGVTEGELTRN